MIWFKLNGKCVYGFEYIVNTIRICWWFSVCMFIVDGCMCLFSWKMTNKPASKRTWHVDPDEYQVSFYFWFSFSYTLRGKVCMDIWHHALDSATSVRFACDVISLVRTFKYTLPNRLILRLRLQKKKKQQQQNDKVKIVHSHLQLFDWMTAESEKSKH